MYQVYDTKNNLPLEFSKLTQSVKPLLPIRVWSSQTKYEKLLRNSDYVQLTYPDQITISLFLTNVRKTTVENLIVSLFLQSQVNIYT